MKTGFVSCVVRMETLQRLICSFYAKRACKVSTKACHKSVDKLKLKESKAGHNQYMHKCVCSVAIFKIIENNRWSHFPDQNVVPMSNCIYIGWVVWQQM